MADDKTTIKSVPLPHVQMVLEEFFKSYIMIGYDYEGNLVVFRKIMTPQEMDAMSAAMTREGIPFEEHIFKNADQDEPEE